MTRVPSNVAGAVAPDVRTEVSTPYFESSDVTIWNADARTAWRWLPENAVDAIVTSPPYWGLRDYGVEGQLGAEDDPETYVDDLADVLTGYVRVLKGDGSLWLNIGDTYAHNRTYQVSQSIGPDGASERGAPMRVPDGFQQKSLLMVPERVVLALIERGWIVRSKVVWHKPNAMPESVRDRLSNRWEVVYHLVRTQQYHFDLDAIREPHAPVSLSRSQRARRNGGPVLSAAREAAYHGNAPTLDPADLGDGGKNPGDVWEIPTKGYSDAHFAVFPPQLVERPIKATVPAGGVVLDPFFGSGTTGVMARRLGRKAWGIELNPDYCQLAADRFAQEVLPLEAS